MNQIIQFVIVLVFIFLNSSTLTSFYGSHVILLTSGGTAEKEHQSLLSTGIQVATKAGILPEENNNASSQSWVQVAVVSDRNTSRPIPIKGMVHSVLMYTTAPVAFHIFSEQRYAWLRDIEKKTPYVKVYYYSSAHNFERAARLVEESKFKTFHPSAIPSMSRLFIGQSPFQPIGRVPKVLVVDDDLVFYRDISELWKIVTVNQSSISLFCPPDSARVLQWLSGQEDNGDVEGGRYCQGGLMALPVAAYPGAVNTSKYFWDATFDMTAQYPNIKYQLAHQQVLNRMFVKHKSTIDIIPCNWHGDTHSCRVPRDCLCEGESYTYHFLNKAYMKNPHMFSKERPSWAFAYYTSRPLNSILPGLNERIREKERHY